MKQIYNKNNTHSSISTISIYYNPQTVQSLPHLNPSHHSTRLHPPPPQPIPLTEQVFDDNKLKLPPERSQPPKQSAFNRFRINLYRRFKKPFYQSSLNNPQATLRRKQNHTAIQFKQSKTLQNRTSFRRRKLVSFEDKGFNKCKTYSSQNKQSRQNLNREFKDNKEGKGAQSPVFQLSISEPKRLDKTVQFNPQLSNIHKAIVAIPQERVRNLSNLTVEGSQPLKKVHLQQHKLNSHSRTIKTGHKSQVRITIDEQKERRAAYQAWENVDVFSSNKNGIVEYTRKAVESSVEVNVQPSKKSCRRFLYQ